jgi:hypothetical protein
MNDATRPPLHAVAASLLVHTFDSALPRFVPAVSPIVALEPITTGNGFELIVIEFYALAICQFDQFFRTRAIPDLVHLLWGKLPIVIRHIPLPSTSRLHLRAIQLYNLLYHRYALLRIIV